MNCAYHTHNSAVVSCNGCGKPLCPACDHRIKGFPFCQDCIVSGVSLLQNRTQNQNYVPFVKKQSSPIVATILSMICPGLGAAYNGQNSKAITFFAIFVGLFQMAVLTNGFPLFVLGFFGMWAFSALDAWKTAKAIRSGVTIENAEDVLIQKLTNSPKIWGVSLAVLGVVSLIYSMGFSLPMREIISLGLIGLGAYFLKDFISSKKVNKKEFENIKNPPSAVTGGLYETNFRTGNFSDFDEYKTQNEQRNWKSGA
jgi:hypothetical protein